MKKYEHLYHVLYNQITSGALASGSLLPTEGALSASHGVSRQTVRKALEMLREAGLVYSVQGSGTYVKSVEILPSESRHIAVITTYFSEYIFPSILRGISEIAVENDYTVEIATTNNSTSRERDILNQLQKKSIAGIIAEGTKAAIPNPNLELYRQISRRGIPVVFINSFYPELIDRRIISVTTDDYNGGRNIVHLLTKQGHTAIGGIFKSDDAQGIARYSGFLSALTENDIQFNDHYFIWYTSETRSLLSGTLLSDQILSECSAIVCYNDQVAEIVCSCLRRVNHSVRAIVSFDQNMNPDLVPDNVFFYSLPHPRKELGRVAAQKLVNLLNGQEESSAVLPWSTD